MYFPFCAKLCLDIVLFFKQNQIILKNMTLPKFEKSVNRTHKNTSKNTEATPGRKKGVVGRNNDKL